LLRVTGAVFPQPAAFWVSNYSMIPSCPLSTCNFGLKFTKIETDR
jgi:hypothetical protein